ncbi:TPA: DUF1566 domain-containing protein [Vibrio vulnificus]|nr:DUF1566 domain-containing protein [Vibrio vulnificus]
MTTILPEGDSGSSPVGNFARFRQDSYEGIGINGQSERWCQKLSSLNFAGQSWRIPSDDEVKALYSFENSEDKGMFDRFGWPVSTFYHWTSTPYSSSKFQVVSLTNGAGFRYDASLGYAVSCVANL